MTVVGAPRVAELRLCELHYMPLRGGGRYVEQVFRFELVKRVVRLVLNRAAEQGMPKNADAMQKIAQTLGCPVCAIGEDEADACYESARVRRVAWKALEDVALN